MATHSSTLGLENPMDRGTWQATVHGVARVRHDLTTKPPSKAPTFHGDEWMGGELLFQSYSKQMQKISNQARKHSIYSTWQFSSQSMSKWSSKVGSWPQL